MTIPAEYRQAHLTLGCQWGTPPLLEYCLKHDRDMTPNGCPVAVKAAREIGADALNRAAEAWDEGFVAGLNADMGDWYHPPEEIANPYRIEQEDQ